MGKQDVLAQLNKEIDKLRVKTQGELVDLAADIKELSQQKTPRDDGILAGSHYVDEQDFGTKDFTVKVGCTAEYALYVHEDLEAKHTVGEAKFLENAIDELTPKALDQINDNLKL